ncbi:RelA/SpoT family protein [Ignatzschineria cameli]|uniref:guanosine-3',5'-bis(diphosphate) 3'-diphosphatase n=1 Tax=Ignatzschineria cameli TaxID=2182793 RepID=A0A2U2AQY2_9GAMM|nr:bifunctional (p)ppGpp synthetase/guanosine-3',5'-bis(diphosphate) 3'-pyrophosphohydrolase [Ignatzschineria cameli]PWD86301.1 bifunctional (p)ppGpp synthetase/guanosine-3',5'-bis(diphosphate) 3'-pyrophosphohydrolase [Ignatzschineria cameli]PWD89861.1 bifunctional (p)ppGpp synthetase/guanosine-3',5'-bis(diphosphate) 3'-pyrophosphohydrolase [Ignatzschineria cameli]PWD91511.1 bifunctional (p)ppGpp synthetase/guanosine-3',5'-bis(diphosphate) 3'-pyrophosphohydrolase [Ignatzschineria cameli]PWD9254
MEKYQLPPNLLPWRKEFEIKVGRLLRIVGRYLSEEEVKEVERACIYGAFAHQEQFRSSGEPYIFHPLAVALILTEVQIDKASLVGAVLHDVIEDTEIGYDEIAHEFGEEVAQIVDGVTKLTQIKFRSKEEAKAENFRKMILAMTKDLRIIMVKLADRLHNMRTLGALAAYKKRRIANETLEIYAPIAARLGMYALQVYLENLCFENIYPMRYAVLSKAIEEKYESESENLTRIKDTIYDRLVRGNILSRISTRKKHLWSIYNKLKVKGKIELVYDIFAIRVIVSTVDECYRVLGMVHQLYKPIIGGFKDYIAIPKGNGYQSLHTIVFGRNGLPVEVQIRTRDMHVIAEAGAAAHWRYKDAYEGQQNQIRTNKWLDSVTELQDSAISSVEFMEAMKANLFPKEIYLFTPKGRIIELPKGSTGIDFAYAVHTEVGNHCRAIIVDGQQVPFSQSLHNGQTVEIITEEERRPSPKWLDYVVSARARTSILAYLSKLSSEEAYNIGERLLALELENKGIILDDFGEKDQEVLLEELELGSKEELLISIGRGKYPMHYIINRFLVKQGLEVEMHEAPDEDEDGLEVSSDIIIGAEKMKTTLGRCCYPLPGESIIGYLSQRHGMVIHQVDCANVENYKKHEDRWIPLAWSKKARGDFPVQLTLIAKNRRGAIASVSAKVTEMNLDFGEFTSEPMSDDIVKIRFVVDVQDRKHLADIMRELRLLPMVERVSRR